MLRYGAVHRRGPQAGLTIRRPPEVNDRIVRAGARPLFGRVASIAVAIGMVGLVVSSACAQTLSNPNPQPGWPPPKTSAKAKPAARVKTCSAYGAGFVNVPGTDTCVKVGGWVTVEGGH
jgi:hypothetical protein